MPTYQIGAMLTGAIAILAISVSTLAQTAATSPPAPGARSTDPAKPFSFFISSEGLGNGANLGGLAGADALCQRLATAVNAGNKTWHAYLSTQAADGVPAVNARDRIGQGPWFNTRGALIAKDLAQLNGDTLELARVGNNISKATAFTEKNESINGFGDKPNQHDILTGSLPDGRAYPDAADHTCKNYTSNSADGSVQLGHFDRTGGNSISWNSAHPSKGCGQQNLVSTGGAGLLYCFAVNSAVN